MPRCLFLSLALLAACEQEEPPVTDDTDTDVDDPDPEVPDLDGTLAEATSIPSGTWSEPTELARDVIQPSAGRGDKDFYKIPLAAGVPYHLWVDTGANLLCDTLLRVYPPGSTTEASWQETPTGIEQLPGDSIAVNDDMIFRMRGSDPALLFVPPTAGDWFAEVVEYNDATGGTPGGGPLCRYSLMIWERSPTEIECNDATEVLAALIAADTDGVPGLPPLATTPADQPILASEFLEGAEEFSGWRSQGDDDVWRFRIGNLDTPDESAVWQWSLWPTDDGGPLQGHRLELLDSNFEVVAATDVAIPDGHHGFASDPGILYPVRSNTTWYLRVADPTVAPAARASFLRQPGPSYTAGLTGGRFYVGTAHGYGPSIANCPSQEINWWETETTDPGSKNDDFDASQLLRFCQVGSTDVYGAYIIGSLKPEGLDFRYERPETPGDPATPVRFPCGGAGSCPDEDYYSIRRASSAGGSVGGRRITVAIQARSVGSLADVDVFLFYNNERVNPFAWPPGPQPKLPFRLAEGEVVLQTQVPADAESVFILVQHREGAERVEQNTYFMRVIVDPNPPPGSDED